ncbi:MAG: hypothetical protein U0525_04800 [Patescibacteria group bacterium]
MSTLKVISNPKNKDIEKFIKNHSNLQEDMMQMIRDNNVRVRLSLNNEHVLLVFYIPEYIVAKRKISSVEINAFYDRKKNEATVFAFNTNHFFDKYKKQIESIEFKTFGKFLEGLLSIILEDEAKILEHILQDTQEVKDEYATSRDSTIVIRHLTNNLTNITTLKLLFDNLNQLLDKAEEYIRNYEDSIINYQRNYITEELQFAKEYCETLMTSLNTKYQVKMTDILYSYTRYTFIIFFSGAVFQIVDAFHKDTSPIKTTFMIALLTTILGSLLMLKKF